MNFEFLTTRAMELMGIRALSEFSARIFGHPHPPSVMAKADEIDWTREEFISYRQDARYSLIANAIRGSMTVPLVYGTVMISAGWIPFVTAMLLSLHILVVVVDKYRLSLTHELEPLARPADLSRPRPRRSPPVTFKTSGYFRPRSFENEPLFRMLGVEWVRRVVVCFVEWSKLSKEDRARGEEVHYVESGSRSELIQFEAATRTSEGIHLICALWNLPALWILTLSGSPWVIFAVLMFTLDAYLVLLQRYHRARVWALITSLLGRFEARHLGTPDELAGQTLHGEEPDPSSAKIRVMR